MRGNESRRSGEDGGGGADTYDEGYIVKATTYGDPIVHTSCVNDLGDTPPIYGPTAGFCPVGYFYLWGADPPTYSNVLYRSFWRFDLSGVALVDTLWATITFETRDGLQSTGYANDLKFCEIRAGWNVIGDQLTDADWNNVFPYLLDILDMTNPGQWPQQWETPETWTFRTLEPLIDGAGEPVKFFDVRLRLTNYVPADTAFRVDLSSGDHGKTSTPYLSIWTASREEAIVIPALVHSGAVAAKVGVRGTQKSLVHSGTAQASVQARETVFSTVFSATRSATVRKEGA